MERKLRNRLLGKLVLELLLSKKKEFQSLLMSSDFPLMWRWLKLKE
jgi:hypothetical protein